MAELKAGFVVAAAELTNAEHQGVDLADAVLDPVRFPHVARLHGIVGDLLAMDVPAEVECWLKKLAHVGPLPEAKEINQAITRVAAQSPNPFYRVLARFMLFEMLCLRHRLLLRRAHIQLEVMNGRQRDVEVLCAAEVETACELAAELLAVDDPVVTIGKMANLALSRYVTLLRGELAELSDEIHDQLERRRKILAAAERVDAADAILVINKTADEFGEEELSAAQLRGVHPLLLGDLSDDAIYKRVERLPGKVEKDARKTTKSFAEVMIAIMEEVEQ